MGRSKKNKAAEGVKEEEVRRRPVAKKNAKSEAEIIAESNKRRIARKKQHIRIHADRIENLDETAEKIKKEGVEAKETGYKCTARVYYRESRWNWFRKIVNWLTAWAYPHGKSCMPIRYINRMELKRNFVKNKVVTRCVTVFLGKNKGKETGLVMQPVPVEFLNRMAVEHIEEKPLGMCRRYPFYMDLNSYSAVEIMRCAGVNPLANRSVVFRLTELKGKESSGELAYYYKMQPIGDYVPMNLPAAQPE